MKILFNADDFGLTKGVTDGIIKAHTDGVVDATTLMMNGLAYDYAVAQAKKHPTLKIGIHLVLTWGKPICREVPDLINQHGFFKFTSGFTTMCSPNIEQVENEWEAQIDRFLATGLPLHHIDSHHHIHGWYPLKEVVIKLAKKYNVPVRYVDSLKDHHELLLTEMLWIDFYDDGVTEHIFSELKELDVKSVEIMTHPAYIDDDLRKVSSYVEVRATELDILCSLKMPNWVKILSD